MTVLPCGLPFTRTIGTQHSTIQQKFDEIVLNPPGKAPFRDVGHGGPVPVDATNHRSLNLENLLSYRKISEWNGPPISSFIEN